MQTLVDTSVAARFDGLLDVLESGLQQQHQEQLLQMVKQQQELQQQVQSQQQLLQAQAQQQALLQQQMQYIASRGKRDSPTTDVREPSDSRTAAATATAAAVHENGRFDVSYDDDTLEHNVKSGNDLRRAPLASIALATAAEETCAKRARAAQD